jgi:hypothetical protein
MIINNQYAIYFCVIVCSCPNVMYLCPVVNNSSHNSPQKLNARSMFFDMMELKIEP